MRNHSTATTFTALPAAPPPITRDRRGLLDALAIIDEEGWECATAAALLSHIREDLIRPLAADVGLRGAVASQAEATAWETVWLLLCDPHLRSARSPWGVVWQTARRALLSEILATRWGTDSRRAWEREATARAGAWRRPVSLDVLMELACEPVVEPWPLSPPENRVTVALDRAEAALVGAGWRAETASKIVNQVAAMDEGLSYGATVVGWRPLAERLGLPPWQARRLTFVLRGSVDGPGLLARLITDGPGAAVEPSMRTALASTCARDLPTPTRKPRGATGPASRPHELAS
jgi:hypothetical protein